MTDDNKFPNLWDKKWLSPEGHVGEATNESTIYVENLAETVGQLVLIMLASDRAMATFHHKGKTYEVYRNSPDDTQVHVRIIDIPKED